MDKARVLKALLWIIQENGGLLHEIDAWLGELKKAGYIETELRKIDGCNLPHWILTEKGKEKLK
jgi:CYTH domain-containing protein